MQKTAMQLLSASFTWSDKDLKNLIHVIKETIIGRVYCRQKHIMYVTYMGHGIMVRGALVLRYRFSKRYKSFIRYG